MPQEDKTQKFYLVVQFTILTVLFFLAYFYNDNLPFSVIVIVSSFVIYSSLSLGFVLDRHKISFSLEALRILFMSLAFVLVLWKLQHLDYAFLALMPLLVFLPWIIKRKAAFQKTV